MDTPGVIISRVMPTAHNDLQKLDQLVTELVRDVEPSASNPGLKTPAAPQNEDQAKSLTKWMGFG
jgi:hypothetical protein